MVTIPWREGSSAGLGALGFQRGCPGTPGTELVPNSHDHLQKRRATQPVLPYLFDRLQRVGWTVVEAYDIDWRIYGENHAEVHNDIEAMELIRAIDGIPHFLVRGE